MILTIRPATPNDAPGLARVRVETWQATYRGLIADPILDRLDVDSETERYREGLELLDAAQFVYVALDGAPEAQIAGYCIGGAERTHDEQYTGEIYALYVLPRCQGQGVGRALLEAGAAWLRARGHHGMVIYALDKNLPAHGFYRALGGLAVREKPLVIEGIVYREVGFGYLLGG